MDETTNALQFRPPTVSNKIEAQNPNSHLYTPKELAALLKVSPKTIYYWVTRNEIPYVRMGRHLRFIAHDVMNHFTMKTEEAKPSCFRGLTTVNNRYSGSLKIGDRARPGNLTSSKKE